MENRCKRLPQDLLAEAMWCEWAFNHGIVREDRIKELMIRYNLKPKKGRTVTDVALIIGKRDIQLYKSSTVAIAKIAEEIDKLCVIARWEQAIAQYK